MTKARNAFGAVLIMAVSIMIALIGAFLVMQESSEAARKNYLQPVKIGDTEITYKNGRISKVNGPDMAYRFTYKNRRLIKVTELKGTKNIYKVKVDKYGRILSLYTKKGNEEALLKNSYGKNYRAKNTLIELKAPAMKFKLTQDLKYNGKKDIIQCKEKSYIGGKYTSKNVFKVKNSYKNGRLVSRKVIRSGKAPYTEKIKYKRIKASKWNYWRNYLYLNTMVMNSFIEE